MTIKKVLIVDDSPTDLSNLKNILSTLEGMLAKDPDERFQTTDELISGIDWIEQS
jgi:PleD family two-component response regulator